MNLKVVSNKSETLPYAVKDNDAEGKILGAFANSDLAYSFASEQGKTSEQRASDGMNAIRRDYNEDVESMAASVKSELEDRLNDQETDLRDWLIQHLDESIDGCGRVIYTHSAMLGVMASDNDGAYFEDFGDEGAVEDGSIQWSKLCYSAMRRDVIEELGRMGVDVDKPTPECESCNEDDEEERYKHGDDWLCETCHNERLKEDAKAKLPTLTKERLRELCAKTGEAAAEDATGDEMIEMLEKAIEDEEMDVDEVLK